ncbi:MAG: sulfotransferase domain-containing protein [Desulfamplus sp.]|nr:sulfotransferase domain-containing protein [Desulfamplus sp.]
MLPNFFCIGAQKCGTTTIWHILDAHPDIFMAQPRETKFFYDELQFAEGIQKYEVQYFSSWAGQTAAGEKCPEYLYVPVVAQRIYETIGTDVKFIIVLRSPAQRAFSHYRHNMMMLRECRSFDEALESEYCCMQKGESIPVPYGYIMRGFYANQLKTYLNFFDLNQFLILNFEKEIATNQKVLSDRLFDFLGVKRFYSEKLPYFSGHPRLEDLTINIKKDGNDPKKHFVEISRERFDLRQLIKLMSRKKQRQNWKHRIYNPSPAMIQFAHNLLQNKSVGLKLSPKQELEINRRYFFQEIEQLNELIQFDLNDWLK